MSINQENLEPKYPDLSKMSRAERDQEIFKQLEILANELARVAKLVEKIQDRV